MQIQKYITDKGRTLLERLRSVGCWVLADGRDNSVTFSRGLLRELRRQAGMNEGARVMVFRVGDEYGIVLNPDVPEGSAVHDIQYNSKYKCVGFACEVPSVARILYDYGLPSGVQCRIGIAIKRIGDHRVYVMRRGRVGRR